MINFDNIGAMPLLPEVIDFVKNNIELTFGDEQNLHSFSRKSQATVEQARIIVANAFNVAPATIRFTHSATEANNLIINYIHPKNTSAIITSEFEHFSVLKTLKQKAKQLGIPIYFVATNADTGINLKNLKVLLKQNPRSFVSLAHVNRITGRLLPIKRTSDLCKKYGAIFHSDISLTAGKLSIDLQNLDVDFASVSGRKLGAMIGSGLLYAKRRIELSAIYAGVNNEYGLVPGSQNPLAIASLAIALKINLQHYKSNFLTITNLKNYLHKKLIYNKISFQSICFEPEHFLPHIINIYIQRIKNIEKFLILLDLNDIAVGYDDLFEKSLIISLSKFNSFEEIDIFVKKLKEII